MEQIIKPEKKEWKQLLQRPYVDNTSVLTAAQTILNAVKQHGDEALFSFTKKFDGVELERFQVTDEEFAQAEKLVDEELKEAIQQARQNIEAFHLRQMAQVEKIETATGVQCWRKSVGIERVGLYVPGGTAPLFSTVLMLGIPAIIAGCREIVLCTPSNAKGAVHPAVLYAAASVGIRQVFKLGGAQAIAAMAYGTASVPSVDKIFGPGNQYVTAAKQLAQMQGVAIDMPAGPSEVCVLADETADASFVAADLLSQAEHGTDSQVLLVTTSEALVAAVQAELEAQIPLLPRHELARKALDNSKAIVVTSKEEAIELVNTYASEHLIISCSNAEELAEKVVNAGSVFIGPYSPESVGDYASGTNHTLPTNGFARAYSGVSVDSYVKKITFQKLTSEGLRKIAPTVIAMAEAEGLQAHAEAVRKRTASLSLLTPLTGEKPNTQPSLLRETAQNTTSLKSGARALDVPPLVGTGAALVRENIRRLKPYSSARSEFSGEASVFLDANENSFGSPLLKWYNRYPDPLQWELKKKIAGIKNVAAANMLLGNGSDECIDLLIRAFCNPKTDNIIICPPTYGTYEVYAHINDVPVKEVNLLANYQLNLPGLEEAVDAHTKLIFLCSPNNPTGNSLHREDVEMVLNNVDSIVVVDEAYINYSRQRSFVSDLKDYPNLVVMQTFSKAWGLAALRLGITFASEEIIDILNKIKPPYNINEATQELALKALDHLEDVNAMIKETISERAVLVAALQTIPFVQTIFPTDANFVLVRMKNATRVYDYLKSKGIIVRNRSNVVLCDDSLRITVGTGHENKKLIEALNEYPA